MIVQTTKVGILVKNVLKNNVKKIFSFYISESPTSSRSGSLSDDLSSESNISLSKMEHRSLDFKLLLDEVKSGQQVSSNLILRQYLLLIGLLFQVTIHLVAPSRQEKAAWLTDIAQVRLKKKLYLTERERELSLHLLIYTVSTLSTNFFQLHVFFSLSCSVWITYISMDYSTTLCLMPVPPHYLSV